MKCKHELGTSCAIAERLAGRPVCRTDGACEWCAKDTLPQQLNRVTVSLAIHSLQQAGREREGGALFRMYHEFFVPDPAVLGKGPGTELHHMLHILGFDIEPGCKCMKHILEMNTSGVQWCESNVDVIVGWMREEAQRRKLPFIASLARRLVFLAIWRARRYASAH